MARAIQTTGWTNGRGTNWTSEVAVSPFRALFRRQQTFPSVVAATGIKFKSTVLRSMHNEQWSLDHNISIFVQIEESSTALTDKRHLCQV